MSTEIMGRRLAPFLAAAAVLAGGAFAAGTPVSPLPGAVVPSSYPAFSWRLPANEQSLGLYVADRADLTPDGKFPDENVVEQAAFTTDQRQWSPSRPLYAGQYWWLVWSGDRSTSQTFYSTPTSFTIPVSLNLLPVKTVRSTFLHLLAVRVRWIANVHALTVRARVRSGKKIVWQRTDPQVNAIGFPYSTSFAWYRPTRIKRGLRLRLDVTLRAQGVAKTRSLVVRAP